MTVCPKCEGSGELRVPVTEHMGTVLYGTEQCDECGGSGYVNMTNEEWLHTLNTEQLAKEIYGFVWCSNELWQQLCCNGDGTDEESDLRIVREWLKQPHK